MSRNNATCWALLAVGELVLGCADSGTGGGGAGGAPAGGASPCRAEAADPKCAAYDEATCSCAGCNDACDSADEIVSDCVCDVCKSNPFCDACNNDERCDPYNESCACADCAIHPLCG